MIFRTFDPTTLNDIANIPSVRATIGGHVGPVGHVDYSDCAARPADFILLTNGSDAASIFERKGPVILDGHSIFAPSCRGRAAIRQGRLMIDWLFANTDTLIITGATPCYLRGARMFNRLLGFASDGVHVVSNEHWTQDHEYFHILRSEWPPRNK